MQRLKDSGGAVENPFSTRHHSVQVEMRVQFKVRFNIMVFKHERVTGN